MKKFLAACLIAFAVCLLAGYLYYNVGVFIPSSKPATTAMTVSGKKIYITKNGEKKEFHIRGVDMGIGIPGHFATDFAVKKETYLRWFKYIQEMGANTIRVYTVQNDDFYEAVYEYNKDNPNPLYFIHGVWVNDYVQNSHFHAYDDEFFKAFIKDTKTLIDIIHGNKNLYLGRGVGGGFYRHDISQWVIGYILGVEWEDVTVAYTDKMEIQMKSFKGRYMQTTEDATPFEAMLARVGDEIISYETKRYSQQRLVAFSNWPTTDPFEYSERVSDHFFKITKVDTEHIKTTAEFISGTFASYHVYPYYPDYLNYDDNKSQYVDVSGKINTYYTYLKRLNDHHTVPVVISEFGVPSSRGMAQRDTNTGRNQGRMSEAMQGQALAQCYNDIKSAGCAGAIAFAWQDEWFKRTWNTMHSVDLLKTPFWSDYQTNEQYFGLLSFDPGKEKSICYVDGDLSDWSDKDVIISGQDTSLSVKYDEKFIYLLAHQKGLSSSQKLYIPIDLTPKSGALKCNNYNLTFNCPVDFVISIDGKDSSRVLVQERYEVLRAMYYNETHAKDAYEFPPAADTSVFSPIDLIIRTPSRSITDFRTEGNLNLAEVYETGFLTYGNANPKAPDYNSLADFCLNGDYAEIKIPWQLLNFSNPSEMQIHDDYYQHYGVENMSIREMYFGIGTGKEKINLSAFPLKGWKMKLTYHERLKPSYYALQKLWVNEGAIEK